MHKHLTQKNIVIGTQKNIVTGTQKKKLHI